MWKYRIRKDKTWEEPQYRREMKKGDYVFFEGEGGFEVNIREGTSGTHPRNLFESGKTKFTDENPHAGKIKANLASMGGKHFVLDLTGGSPTQVPKVTQVQTKVQARKLIQGQIMAGTPRIPPG